ncbi:MAG: hypothetical protein ACKOHM_07955 [Spartobacteria bacterium]
MWKNGGNVSPNTLDPERGEWLVGSDHWNIAMEGFGGNQAIERV